MRRIDPGERRARLGERHHLIPSAQATSPLTAAEDQVGLHASDPMSVYLAARARVDGLAIGGVTAALYDDRALLRVVAMRTTLFVMSRELAAVALAACSRSHAVREADRLARWVERAGLSADGGAWLRSVKADTEAALDRLGEATASELSGEVSGLRDQLPVGEGTAWQGTVGVATRILFLLAAEGRIVRGRPRGTVVSSLYRWVPLSRWVPGGLPAHDEGLARADLLRRWLAAYGPGTIADLRWWTGWPLRDVRQALAGVKTVEVDLGGTTGLVLEGDDAPPATPPASPWIALLPALDSTAMGWADRDWYLGTHRGMLFDRNGNAGPTVWIDGRVVGGWAHRPDGQVVVRLLEDVGGAARRAVDAEADAVSRWLGAVRVIPRFRTPLEVELTTAHGHARP